MPFSGGLYAREQEIDCSDNFRTILTQVAYLSAKNRTINSSDILGHDAVVLAFDFCKPEDYLLFSGSEADMDIPLFLAFCASFFLIALSPGLCMTLALSLGISIGVRRTLWMMLGELVGIALVGAAALGGVASLLLSAPDIFAMAKMIGAAYLLWSAVRAWRAPADMAIGENHVVARRGPLVSQGFITAISNPKAWIFFAALLPPFIDPERPLWPQLVLLLSAMVSIEFICLLIYAQGGRVLRDYLANKGLAQWLNRISAGLMAGVAGWLVFG